MDSRDNLWQRANQAMPYFAGTAAILIVGGTAIAMLCGVVIGLPPEESCIQCAREWIGSLSGWGAVVVGAVAAIAAINNLSLLRSQVEMQRVTILTNNKYQLETRKTEASAIKERVEFYIKNYEAALEGIINIQNAKDQSISINKFTIANGSKQPDLKTIGLRAPFPEYQFDRMPAPIPYEGFRFSEGVETITDMYNSLPDEFVISEAQDDLYSLYQQLRRIEIIGRKLIECLSKTIAIADEALQAIDRETKV